jgi:hypothetical protein
MAETPPGNTGADSGAESSALVDQDPSLSAQTTHRYPNEEVLPSISSDEQDIGWGDDRSAYSDDWYQSERPPHHG